MVAGRLRESLARHLGEEAIFRDKDSIGAGEDWTRAIDGSLTADAVVLALIGPGWATAQDESGLRRLDNPADWNRIELELALARTARVIPLLIDETRMPKEADLPESLRPLVRLNALKLRDDDWDSDVERLMQALNLQLNRPWLRRPAVLAVGVVAAVAIGAAGYWWSRVTGAGPSSTAGMTVAVQEQERPPAATVERGSSYLADVREKLRAEQAQALEMLFSNNPADRAKAIGLIDANLGHIDKALQSFPDDVYLLSLAGYAAKNVYASSSGTDLLSPEQRKKYLAQARKDFESALRADPNDPGAMNGMGNVLFYERRFDEAIQHHERAIKLAGGSYPAARHDLELVRRVKSGALPFPE